jgi:hypothetical protein
MRGSLASALLAGGLFALSAAALAESPEPPRGGCGDCAAAPRCGDCPTRGPKVVVEQPPVEVVFQQAPATVCGEKCGCLRRLFCCPHTTCRTVAPIYTYAAPPVQSYALTAPATQSYALAAPVVQSFALAAAPAQSFALSTPSYQSFALVAPGPDVNLTGAQALTLQPNVLGAQALQSVAQQALAAYTDKLRAALAQAEAAKAESAEATNGDCCKKVDAVIAAVKELQTVVITQGTQLANHEKRIQTLEKK